MFLTTELDRSIRVTVSSKYHICAVEKWLCLIVQVQDGHTIVCKNLHSISCTNKQSFCESFSKYILRHSIRADFGVSAFVKEKLKNVGEQSIFC